MLTRTACCSPWHLCTSWCGSAEGEASTRTGCASCGRHRLWGSCHSAEGSRAAEDDRQGSRSNQESVKVGRRGLNGLKKRRSVNQHLIHLAKQALCSSRAPEYGPSTNTVLRHRKVACCSNYCDSINSRSSSQGTSLRCSCAAAGTSSSPCRRGEC